MAHEQLSNEEWTNVAGLTTIDAQAFVSRMLQRDGETFNSHGERILALRRLSNSLAFINAKLPVEILVAIFRLAGPARSSRATFRLTHVCHAWRNIIHHTPVYWVDFLSQLSPGPLIGRRLGYWHPVIAHAVARSAPMRFKFCLYGDFLLALKTPTAEEHLSRMSALYLDCVLKRDQDMRLFFDLHLPALESLELHLSCTLGGDHANIHAAESPARFPRLRTLRTNCAGFPLAWVGSSLRELRVGAGTEADSPRVAYWTLGCSLPSIHDLLEVLRRCPGLELLHLYECLPDDGPPHHPTISAPLTLPHLRAIGLQDKKGAVRSLLDCLVLPRQASIKTVDSVYI